MSRSITEDLCRRFLENPGINPKTGRKLVFGKGPYKEYVNACRRYPSLANLLEQHLNRPPAIPTIDLTTNRNSQGSSSSSSASSSSSSTSSTQAQMPIRPSIRTETIFPEFPPWRENSRGEDSRGEDSRAEMIRPPVAHQESRQEFWPEMIRPPVAHPEMAQQEMSQQEITNQEVLVPQNAIISPTTGVPKIPPPNFDMKIEEPEVEESEELLKYIPHIPPLGTILPSEPPLPMVFVNTRKQVNIPFSMLDLHTPNESNSNGKAPVIPLVPQSRNNIPVIPFRDG